MQKSGVRDLGELGVLGGFIPHPVVADAGRVDG